MADAVAAYNALHEGIGRDGKHLYSAFPYTVYTLMTRTIFLAIKAYLFNLEPVRDTPPENDMWFPFNQRYLMWFGTCYSTPDSAFSRTSIKHRRGIGAHIEHVVEIGCDTARSVFSLVRD